MENKMHIGGIFGDLVKVCDCMNHEILSQKLKYYGIQGSIFDWFKSHLINRKHRVELNSFHPINIFQNWTLAIMECLRGLCWDHCCLLYI